MYRQFTYLQTQSCYFVLSAEFSCERLRTRDLNCLSGREWIRLKFVRERVNTGKGEMFLVRPV